MEKKDKTEEDIKVDDPLEQHRRFTAAFIHYRTVQGDIKNQHQNIAAVKKLDDFNYQFFFEKPFAPSQAHGRTGYAVIASTTDRPCYIQSNTPKSVIVRTGSDRHQEIFLAAFGKRADGWDGGNVADDDIPYRGGTSLRLGPGEHTLYSRVTQAGASSNRFAFTVGFGFGAPGYAAFITTGIESTGRYITANREDSVTAVAQANTSPHIYLATIGGTRLTPPPGKPALRGTRALAYVHYNTRRTNQVEAAHNISNEVVALGGSPPQGGNWYKFKLNLALGEDYVPIVSTTAGPVPYIHAMGSDHIIVGTRSLNHQEIFLVLFQRRMYPG